MSLDQLEALYGGAAGGGKSEALLAAATQYVEEPTYSAIIFRRTYADLSLPGALMDRAHTWWGSTSARWSDEKKTWLFPSGATITFGYMEVDVHKYRYQGSEYNFVGFDELTQFSQGQYTYLASRIRKAMGIDIPSRLRSASNPGGKGHEWVKQYFIVEGEANDRPFIPARLFDNPFLDQQDYLRSLNLLDPITRQQLLSGNWNARHAGAMFNREWFKVADMPEEVERLVRYWDLAASRPSKKNEDPDYTVGVLMGRGPDRHYYVLDVIRFRGTPSQVENLVSKTAHNDGYDCEIYIEQEPGSAGVHLIDHYRNRVLVGFAFNGIRASGDKAVRAHPFATAVQEGNVSVTEGDWHGTFYDELESFPEGNHDDQLDAAAGAFLQLAAGGELRIASPYASSLFNYR